MTRRYTKRRAAWIPDDIARAENWWRSRGASDSAKEHTSNAESDPELPDQADARLDEKPEPDGSEPVTSQPTGDPESRSAPEPEARPDAGAGRPGKVVTSRSAPGERHPTTAPELPLRPVVSAFRSVHSDYVICMICGERHRNLAPHLDAAHGLDPVAYRQMWNLPTDYSMICPWDRMRTK